MNNNLTLIFCDEKRPYLSVYKEAGDDDHYHVYLESLLFEVVSVDVNSPQFKFFIARLFNSGASPKLITEVFGPAYNTQKRWGDAVKEKDPYIINEVFLGRGARKKITTEIKSYIKHRFNDIYSIEKKSYSRKILEELKEVFNVEVTSETIRPILTELRNSFNNSIDRKKN